MLKREDLSKIAALDKEIAQVEGILKMCESKTIAGSAKVGLICTNSAGLDWEVSREHTSYLQYKLDPIQKTLKIVVVEALKVKLHGLKVELGTYIREDES